MFYNSADKVDADGNGNLDCQPEVVERCPSGSVRLASSRVCVVIDEYDCTAACGTAGGTLGADLGRSVGLPSLFIAVLDLWWLSTTFMSLGGSTVCIHHSHHIVPLLFSPTPTGLFMCI